MIRSFKSALPIAAALATALALPAAAQTTGDMLANGHGLPGAPKNSAIQEAPQNLPPALPGAATRQDNAIPSNRPSSELSPNDALFDAIDRGNLADARDAVNRGADLGARNILGLTPIDQSVDLNRNDITFMLLSMRGAVGSGSGAKPATASATPAKPGKPPPAKLPLAAAARPAAPTLVMARASDPPPVKRQPVISNPGTPAPQVGFLGFGGVPQQ